ncbi:hypothetical protein RJT34_10016 [Clitoria ternatea]|uniref:DUF7870 domain-containing protein n=1 Tax=Clitoria ternatea TaxID=43366 RepID=A0AAN9K5M1_CLITE
MAIHLIHAAFTPKHLSNKKNTLFLQPCYLIIRLPNSQLIKICLRFMLFALAFTSILFMFTTLENSPVTHPVDQINYHSMNMDQLSSILLDLTNEGLIQKTQQHKTVFLTSEEAQMSHVITHDYNIQLIHLNDIEKQNSVNDNTVDFVFTSDFPASIKFIQRTLKTGGVIVILMNDNLSLAFNKPENYKIVYMRRFNALVIAMKKTSEDNTYYNNVNNMPNFAAPRKLLWYNSEAKKAALQQLEDVLLEPPRAASGKSRKYLKRTRYLPDLMGDSLESYPRRVFIDVGLSEKDGGSGTDWFWKNYPTRNEKFEIYKIDTITEDSSGKEVSQIGISDWVKKSVKEEEYVVMKAEAEVVEEMMRSNSIGLVDELFLECKPKRGNTRDSTSRRAYWECLALYGKLRDEGVAVHQWWG